MEELYWITRLDTINDSLNSIIIFSLLATVLSFLIYIFGLMGYIDPLVSKKDSEGWVNVGKKVLKVSVPIFLCTFIIEPFIPTTKEAYVIYGVGGTIDYLKTDQTAKQIPHKIIVALDRYIEELTPEDNSSQEESEKKK